MRETEERGRRFVAMMLAILCVVAGLLALFGVPSAAPVSAGLAGMLLGFAAAHFLIPRRDLGMPARTLLSLATTGGTTVGAPNTSRWSTFTASVACSPSGSTSASGSWPSQDSPNP